MNMFADSLTENGKKFSADRRFELVIHIQGSSDDPCAMVLRRMYKGTVLVYGTLTAAAQAQNEYLNHAMPVIKSMGELAVYGMTAIMDTRDGTINCVCEMMDR